MGSYSGSANRPDRAKAIAAVLAVHAALAVVIVTGLNVRAVRHAVERLQTFDFREPPPPAPKPPPPQPRQAQAKRDAGAPAKRAEASPIVAPQPRIPVTSPIVAARVAGSGSAPTSGASTAGSGTGAGGSGTGPGGGGDGIGTNPRLLAGKPTRADYHRLGAWISRPTRALIRLTIAPDGRVSECGLVSSSGYPDVDGRLCATLAPPMRWAPARDRSGRAITSWTIYVVTLARD